MVFDAAFSALLKKSEICLSISKLQALIRQILRLFNHSEDADKIFGSLLL